MSGESVAASGPLRPLAEGVAEVWYAFSGGMDDPDRARRQLDLLSADERRRHDRRRSERTRREFRLAHALLRSVLSQYRPLAPGEWRFELGEHGRPEVSNDLDGPPLRFNLSHTDGLVACVVAVGARIGIDVESFGRERSIAKIAERMFSSAERMDLERRAGRDRRERFLEYWTLKEAHLKALGAGMVLPMKSIRFELADQGQVRVSFGEGIEPAGESWHYWCARPSPEHQLAVAMTWSGTPSMRMAEHRP